MNPLTNDPLIVYTLLVSFQNTFIFKTLLYKPLPASFSFSFSTNKNENESPSLVPSSYGGQSYFPTTKPLPSPLWLLFRGLPMGKVGLQHRRESMYKTNFPCFHPAWPMASTVSFSTSWWLQTKLGIYKF